MENKTGKGMSAAVKRIPRRLSLAESWSLQMGRIDYDENALRELHRMALEDDGDDCLEVVVGQKGRTRREIRLHDLYKALLIKQFERVRLVTRSTLVVEFVKSVLRVDAGGDVCGSVSQLSLSSGDFSNPSSGDERYNVNVDTVDRSLPSSFSHSGPFPHKDKESGVEMQSGSAGVDGGKGNDGKNVLTPFPFELLKASNNRNLVRLVMRLAEKLDKQLQLLFYTAKRRLRSRDELLAMGNVLVLRRKDKLRKLLSGKQSDKCAEAKTPPESDVARLNDETLAIGGATKSHINLSPILTITASNRRYRTVTVSVKAPEAEGQSVKVKAPDSKSKIQSERGETADEQARVSAQTHVQKKNLKVSVAIPHVSSAEQSIDPRQKWSTNSSSIAPPSAAHNYSAAFDTLEIKPIQKSGVKRGGGIQEGDCSSEGKLMFRSHKYAKLFADNDVTAAVPCIAGKVTGVGEQKRDVRGERASKEKKRPSLKRREPLKDKTTRGKHEKKPLANNADVDIVSAIILGLDKLHHQ